MWHPGLNCRNRGLPVRNLLSTDLNENYTQPGRKLRGALGFSNILKVAWSAGGAPLIVLFISRLIVIIVIPTLSGDVICGGFSRMTKCPIWVDSRHPMVPPCEKLLITLHFQQ